MIVDDIIHLPELVQPCRYAAKARKIRNKPVQNRNKMGALRQEVETLRKQNQEYQVSLGFSAATGVLQKQCFESWSWHNQALLLGPGHSFGCQTPCHYKTSACQHDLHKLQGRVVWYSVSFSLHCLPQAVMFFFLPVEETMSLLYLCASTYEPAQVRS